MAKTITKRSSILLKRREWETLYNKSTTKDKNTKT